MKIEHIKVMTLLELRELAEEYGIDKSYAYKKSELINILVPIIKDNNSKKLGILQSKTIEDLKNIAFTLGIENISSLSKDELVDIICDEQELKNGEISPDKRILMAMKLEDLRDMGQKYGVVKPYRFRKEKLVDEIILRKPHVKGEDCSGEKSLEQLNVMTLREKATALGIKKSNMYKKAELIKLIKQRTEEMEDVSDRDLAAKKLDTVIEQETVNLAEEGIDVAQLSENASQAIGEMQEIKYVEGILEILQSVGYGFLRVSMHEQSDGDVYVSQSQIRKFNLTTGDNVVGVLRPPTEGQRYNALLYITQINGVKPEDFTGRKSFDKLEAVFPDKRIHLETKAEDLAMRITDIIAPIGFGQRGLIVSPPKAGKTTMLKLIADAITRNHPDAELVVLLIDERPEEVTDIKNSVRGEVISSTFDKEPKEHIKVAEIVLERAKSKVESGKNVIILLDSITRLARAYNIVMPSSGRTLSGGLDPMSLHKPKRFFGAARNTKDAGSLTIIATALVDTGSRMDDVIYEEFKGTGNMELHLDRKLSERRIFPAIDLYKSGTRREELLLTEDELAVSFAIRRAMSQLSPQEVTEKLIDTVVDTENNAIFIEKMKNIFVFE